MDKGDGQEEEGIVSKLLRWTCPSCSFGVLAPSRPRRNDVRRYCLDCSKTSGRLVERVSPKLEAKREAKKKSQAEKRRKAYFFKAPRGYYEIGGYSLQGRSLDLSKIRIRTTKGPGPIARRPDGVFIFRKGDWADKFDAVAQIHIVEALSNWWHVNPHIGETLRCVAYVRQYIAGALLVQPPLHRGLKGAPEEVAMLLRKQAAVEVLENAHRDQDQRQRQA